MKVLVTGATGLIGRICARELVEAGAEVHGVTSAASGSDRPAEMTWHVADLRDPEAAASLVSRVRPTHLLHLAWETQHGDFWTSEENMRWLAAGVELFRAFANSGGQRAVIAGTCAEYLWDDEPCVEGITPLEPRTLYGACKHALDVAVSAYARRTGVSVAWGRVFHLYGPGEGERRLVPSLVVPLLHGEPAACTPGTQVRDFLHVDDAAQAFTTLLATELTGPVNVASGVPTRIVDLALTLGELTGRPELVQVGALPARADDPAVLVADVTRLTQEGGWTPEYDLRGGLAQTVEWWRERL
jgi:nucleoside-diphosphate-sugar epimerase